MVLRKIHIAIITLTLIGQCVCGQPAKDMSWQEVMHDNLQIYEPNSIWQIESEFTRDDEPQIYKTDNVVMVPGCDGEDVLALIVKSENPPLPHCPQEEAYMCQRNNQHHYSSGNIRSRTPFGYGYYEIRAKFPRQPFCFPALWLWNAKNNSGNDSFYNEIDIIEVYNGMKDSMTTNIHYNSNAQTPIGITGRNGATYTHRMHNNQEYHCYGLEWTRDWIVWYIDDEPIRAEKNDVSRIGITHDMYVMMNLALYQYGDNPEQYESASTFPDTMFVTDFKYYVMNTDLNSGILHDIPSFDSYDYSLREAIVLDSTDIVDNTRPVTLRAADFIVLDRGFTVPVGHEVRFVAGRFR